MNITIRYLVAIFISIIVIVLKDFIENRLGLRIITFMGVSVLVWAFVFFHVSRIAKEKQAQIINKVCFYIFIIIGVYAFILGIIHSIKK
ncbi:MAG: hypothetical protein GX075_11640 [Firmicutes bacterium]|nr:hypothetical protein [Bacillota bacterium]